MSQILPSWSKGSSSCFAASVTLGSKPTFAAARQSVSCADFPVIRRLPGAIAALPEGLLRTTTWAGGNADLKVFLFAKAPPTGKGGLLNVTVIQK